MEIGIATHIPTYIHPYSNCENDIGTLSNRSIYVSYSQNKRQLMALVCHVMDHRLEFDIMFSELSLDADLKAIYFVLLHEQYYKSGIKGTSKEKVDIQNK